MTVYVVIGIYADGRERLLRICNSQSLADAVCADKRSKHLSPFCDVVVQAWHLAGTPIN